MCITQKVTLKRSDLKLIILSQKSGRSICFAGGIALGNTFGSRYVYAGDQDIRTCRAIRESRVLSGTRIIFTSMCTTESDPCKSDALHIKLCRFMFNVNENMERLQCSVSSFSNYIYS
jgi:hypothetical protein